MSAEYKAPSTIGEWDKEIEQLDSPDLELYRDALETLREWKAFKEAFSWTRIFILIQSIEQEERRRAAEREENKWTR